MNGNDKNSYWLLLVTATLAFAVGYFVSDDSRKPHTLKSESESLRPREVASTTAHKIARPNFADAQSSQNEAANVLSNSLHQGEAYRAEVSRRVMSNVVDRTAAKVGPVYDQVFSELGLTPEVAAGLKMHLVELHRKAIAAGDPLLELKRSRLEYDEKMRSLLDGEKYAAYLDFERSKPARREYELLAEFALDKKHIFLDPNYQQLVTELINESSATSTESWEGPYDPIPRPETGTEAVARKLTESIDKLKRGSEELLSLAKKRQLPDEYVSILADYYNSTINNRVSSLNYISRPIEEIKKEEILRIKASLERQGLRRN